MCESQFAGLGFASGSADPDRAALCAMMRSYEDVVTRLEEFARALTIHLGAMDVDEPPEASRPSRPSLPPPVPPRASRAPSVPITSATPGAPPAPPKSILKKQVTINPEVRSAVYGPSGAIQPSVPVNVKLDWSGEGPPRA
jgi:hypothetical protein